MAICNPYTVLATIARVKTPLAPTRIPRRAGRRSAGILLHRDGADGPEVLLGHPGGPFWRRKDAGAWTLPKGEIGPGEEPLAAAIREFEEETGFRPAGPFAPLGSIRQSGGKEVTAYACRADFDPSALKSNVFSLEWPPRSGRVADYPELDRVAWFAIPAARAKILTSQEPLLDRLADLLGPR